MKINQVIFRMFVGLASCGSWAFGSLVTQAHAPAEESATQLRVKTLVRPAGSETDTWRLVEEQEIEVAQGAKRRVSAALPRQVLTSEIAMLRTFTDRPAPTSPLSTMVRVGKMAWDVIKNNRSVFDASLDHVSVVPKRVSGPIELSGWRRDQTDSVKVLIEDALGIDMVEFTYHMAFDHSGSFRGQGRYLANVVLVPEHLGIKAIGIKFHVGVKTLDPLNSGSHTAPVASLKANVVLNIEGIFGSALKTDEFVINGDGSTKLRQRSNEDWSD